ncbi:MAG: PTS sugar transporter subunit IIA [Phycisphaerales bacterium]|nr:PTS sugar transporter subunit IIA [Phycisphaerales bacterium]
MTANLIEIIRPECVKVPLLANSRREAIEELVDMLAAAGGIADAAALKHAVWEREQLRSTGIGEGLAIPHGKCASATKLQMAMGRPLHPIEFEAVDRKPVRMIVLLVSPPDRITDHIQALGRFSRIMSDPLFRERAFSAPDAASLYELFRGVETAAAQ